MQKTVNETVEIYTRNNKFFLIDFENDCQSADAFAKIIASCSFFTKDINDIKNCTAYNFKLEIPNDLE